MTCAPCAVLPNTAQGMGEKEKQPPLSRVVGVSGLEPETYRLKADCSTD